MFTPPLHPSSPAAPPPSSPCHFDTRTQTDEEPQILTSSERELLQEGDIIVRTPLTDDVDFGKNFFQVPKAMEGALLVSSDLRRFAFKEEVSLSERQWIYEFLTSDLTEEWAYRHGVCNTEADAVEMILTPVLGPDLLAAYDRARSAADVLREVARTLDAQRDSVLSSEGGIERWHILRRVGVRAEAVSLAMRGISERAFTERMLLPSPIAEGYRALTSASDSRARVEAGLKLGEDVAALLNGIWLTIALHEGPLTDRTTRGLRKNLSTGGWSFGGHLWFAREHLLGTGAGQQFLSFIAPGEIRAILKLLEQVRDSRNSIRHLEGPSSGDFDREAGTLTQVLSDAMRLLAPLAAMRLVVLDDVEQDPVLDMTHAFSGTALMGDHPAGWPVSHDAPIHSALRTGTLYLRIATSEVISPYPFLGIQYSKNPYGLGVLQKIQKEGGVYRSFTPQRKWIEPRAHEWLERVLDK